jgi:hypothetical protein
MTIAPIDNGGLPDNVCPFWSSNALAPAPNSTIQKPGTMNLAPLLLPVVCVEHKCKLWSEGGRTCHVQLISEALTMIYRYLISRDGLDPATVAMAQYKPTGEPH